MAETYSGKRTHRYCAREGFFRVTREAITVPSSEIERRRMAHDPGSGSGGALTSVALGRRSNPRLSTRRCLSCSRMKVELNRMFARVAEFEMSRAGGFPADFVFPRLAVHHII